VQLVPVGASLGRDLGDAAVGVRPELCLSCTGFLGLRRLKITGWKALRGEHDGEVGFDRFAFVVVDGPGALVNYDLKVIA
jgi:hypothetical protein